MAVMPTQHHHEVGRHALEVIAMDGSQSGEAIRENWLATNGPGEQPSEIFYNDVVRMLIDPGKYLVRDGDGTLSLTSDGQMVAAGGDFILGR
jgi:hypothetical protein